MAIVTSQKGKVLWIDIERQEALNAFDIPHLQALRNALAEARDNADIGAVVIAASGRAFSVGADIKAMERMTEAEFAVAAELYQSLCRDARGLDKPIIAAVNGYALGGGLEVALYADIRLAADDAKLGLPDAELGFSPTGGLTYLLNHMIGASRAMHMAMTCEMVAAQQALDWGLVSAVYEVQELHGKALQLASQLAAYPPTGMKNIKRSFNMALESSLNATLVLEAEYDAACYRSAETQQALKDFIASRKK
jgi:enoyl-CoA hydratase